MVAEIRIWKQSVAAGVSQQAGSVEAAALNPTTGEKTPNPSGWPPACSLGRAGPRAVGAVFMLQELAGNE